MAKFWFSCVIRALYRSGSSAAAAARPPCCGCCGRDDEAAAALPMLPFPLPFMAVEAEVEAMGGKAGKPLLLLPPPLLLLAPPAEKNPDDADAGAGAAAGGLEDPRPATPAPLLPKRGPVMAGGFHAELWVTSEAVLLLPAPILKREEELSVVLLAPPLLLPVPVPVDRGGKAGKADGAVDAEEAAAGAVREEDDDEAPAPPALPKLKPEKGLALGGSEAAAVAPAPPSPPLPLMDEKLCVCVCVHHG